MGLIVLSCIAAYLIGAGISAPWLMRQRYLDMQAVQAADQARYEARAAKEKLHFGPSRWTDVELRVRARWQGWVMALVWPFSVLFQLGGTSAFKDEIAAEKAGANARVIAEYDRLLQDRFDRELGQASPSASQRIAAQMRRIGR